jgi:hypothetical protein
MTAAVATPRRPADLWQTLWLALGSPWLLLGLAGWLTLLLLVSLWLPQMPDYLREEGSAASRWLLAAATPYGAFGTLARGLGFFDMLHSPLLLAPLAALILVLLVQIVQQISAAQALRRLPAVLDAAGVNGEPLSLHSPYRLLRWRSAVADTALSQTGQMQMLLQARFVRLERRTMRVAPAPATVDPARSAADSGDGAAPVLEERLLALRGQQAVLLRPLFLAGMLCAALYLWAASALAWHFEAPFLIPGAPAVDSVHDLSLQYELARPVDGVLTPRLRIALGDDSVAAVVASRVEAQVAGVEVVAQAVAPALEVRSLAEGADLARPGQAAAVSALGLGFPADGSEETVLLPGIGAGLRIVRNGQNTPAVDDDVFTVEVYSGASEQPLRRFTVSSSQIETIRVRGPGDPALTLAFVPLPALAVSARSAPGQWLMIVALILTAAGLVGYLQRPGFVLLQVGPWPEQRTVMTVQSDLPSEFSLLRSFVEGIEEGKSDK